MNEIPKEVVITVVEKVGDPFLITALVVVYLMYRLLQRKEKTYDSSLKDVFNELHANALLLTEQAATIQTLVNLLARRDERISKEEERSREEVE